MRIKLTPEAASEVVAALGTTMREMYAEVMAMEPGYEKEVLRAFLIKHFGAYAKRFKFIEEFYRLQAEGEA